MSLQRLKATFEAISVSGSLAKLRTGRVEQPSELAKPLGAPVLISRSRSEVSDHVSIPSGVASVRRKFA
ncbi:MAG: hypothetical protein ACC619_04155, partial [Paracoccaceae bacterium]